MSAYKISEKEQLKIIYQEIIQGSSYVLKGNFYVRHLNELHHTEVLRKKIEFFNGYLQQGLKTQEERLKEIIASGEWTQAKEDHILNLKYHISDNEKNIFKVIQQQQPAIRKIIKQKRDELISLLYERYSIIGTTADEYAEKDAANYIIFLSLYKDSECQDKYFKTWEQFEDLEDKELLELDKGMEECFVNFKEETIRKISIMPFFLNPFSYVKENIFNFIRKPIVELTTFQLMLFSLGTRNLSIVSQSEGEPPEMLDDVDAQKVLDWYDMQYSIILGKRNATK